MNAPLTPARPSLDRPNPFDELRDRGRLAPGDRELNAARWATGDALRTLHRAGWTVAGSSVSPMHTDEARRARRRLGNIMDAIEYDTWRILNRVVLEGAALSECRAFLPSALVEAYALNALADHLRVALDHVGPMISQTERTSNG